MEKAPALTEMLEVAGALLESPRDCRLCPKPSYNNGRKLERGAGYYIYAKVVWVCHSLLKKKIECRGECLTLERVTRHLGRSYSLSECCWLFRIVRWRVLMKLSSKIGRSQG